MLHRLLQFMPWAAFDRLVAAHQSDKHVRGLTTRSQFIALLSGQLAGCESLRAIETLQQSNAHRLYHVGACAVRRSTLADANAKRASDLFVALFQTVLAQAQRGLRRNCAEAVRLIDATCLPLSPLFREVAAKSASVAGMKLHVVYDPQAQTATYFDISPGNVNDITVAQAMPIEPGTTYVFDRGYYHFAWWAALDEAGCRFVTRLKANTPTSVLESRRASDPGIISDAIVQLPERLARSRRNPIAKPVRELHVTNHDGKRLRLITNDLVAPASEIAALYKQRWQVELFFRWVKQNLKIRSFLGQSQNAVRIQIAVALIAFVLIRLAFKAQNLVAGLLSFVRLVRLNLHERRQLAQLIDPKPLFFTPDPRQLTLDMN
jgi:IS4 transposase